MKLQQLEGLAALSRSKIDSLAFRGAKLVLVDGLSSSEAATQLKSSVQAVDNGVRRYRQADSIIREAYEIKTL